MWHDTVSCSCICYYHLQGSCTLQIETTGFFKILVPIYHLHNILKDHNLDTQCCENLKSYNCSTHYVKDRLQKSIICFLHNWTHCEMLSIYNVWWTPALPCHIRCELHAHITSISHQSTNKGICKDVMQQRISQLMISIYSLSHKDSVVGLAHCFLSATYHYVGIMIPDCLSA